ncbi:alpha/beta hydrolase fold domain-containing protein [Kurthia sibirica]|uniref:Alpha/beta hydrolase fold-3 domain-containing protein n=1 Tax=Kurthia sibirica TaxID=202750 RepID=A0A2U3AJ21_9BACL|nr:alpha/beta hydrolase fold domain-containing protein [Kurthia sibirica]PWI24507.1 hypothetical protein DEX24_13015 [Kurthia sibirica]GEK33571.1 esterase [Kurthia sibirica]
MGKLSKKTLSFIERASDHGKLQALTEQQRQDWFHLRHEEPHTSVHIDHAEQFSIPTRDGHELEARVIYPNEESMRPVLLFFHGSFLVNSNFYHLENQLREFAVICNMTVVAVNYRMTQMPTPVNDCIDAIEWVEKNARLLNATPQHIVLCGDGFGASVIAAAEQVIQHDKPNVKAICLFYPSVAPNLTTPSKEINGSAYILETDWIEHFYSQISAELLLDNLLLSPLNGNDFSNHCPVYILCAEYDPLVDEGMLYAKKLSDHGVVVFSRVAENTIHGFFSIPGLYDKKTKQIINEVDVFLKSV